jgi:hypothetical protein
MSTDPLLEERREARGDAILFVVVTMALLIVLAVTSLLAGWELIGLSGWVWLAPRDRNVGEARAGPRLRHAVNPASQPRVRGVEPVSLLAI